MKDHLDFGYIISEGKKGYKTLLFLDEELVATIPNKTISLEESISNAIESYTQENPEKFKKDENFTFTVNPLDNTNLFLNGQLRINSRKTYLSYSTEKRETPSQEEFNEF